MRGQLGPYEILAPIGAGGMGEVYRARDRRLNRVVAIKVLNASYLQRPDARSRFEREARAVAALHHPHICGLYDIGYDEEDDFHFLVMQYLDGDTLAARLTRGPLALGDALRYATEIAEAIDAAHQCGITHRDLKPSNIMLTKAGAVLLDFGLAKLTHSAEALDGLSGPTTTDVSREGVLAGTVRYMAPEVLDGKPADARSDLFSFGAVVYEMLAGRRAFTGDSEARVIAAILADDPPPLTTLRADVPPEFEAIVRTCLAKNPDERWQNAGDVAKQLERISTNWPGTATPADDPTPVRRPGADSPAERQGTPHVAKNRTQRLRRVAVGAAILSAVALALTATRSAWLPAPATAPAVFAVLPPANPTDDPVAEQLGDAIASVVSEHLHRVSGVKLVSREATAPYAAARTDVERITREVGTGLVFDLTVKKTEPAVEVGARLWHGAAKPALLDTTLTGDAVEVQRKLIEGITRALVDAGIGSRASSGGVVLKLPTIDVEAFKAYIEARAQLDGAENPGAIARAIDLLERAVAKDPKFVLAHAALTQALFARYEKEHDKQLLDRADRAARAALQLDPEASEAHAAFATVQNAFGKRDAAVTALHRAIDLQPDNDEAHRQLGEILAAQGNVDAGVGEIRAAVRLRPSFGHYYALGWVLLTRSRYAAALEAFEKATELRPNSGQAFEMLGATHQFLGRTDEAVGNYEHAIRVGPSAMAYSNLATLYFQVGAYDKALTAFLAATERNPNKATLYRGLGDVYVKLNRRNEAHAAYQKAVTMADADLAANPSDPFLVVLVALCEANLERRTDAERHASEALTLSPSNRDILFRVAKVYALTGNRTAALKALRGAIDLGYDRAVARRDPELASLRSLPEFETLLSDEVQR
jgi:tetratricopeptide (TPR) repeat protein/TolB-like protein